MVSSRVKTAWIWLSFSTLSKECPHETWSAKLAEHECPSDSHCFHSAVPQLVIILEADNLPGTLSSMNFVFITFSSLENLICLLLQSQQLYCHSTLPLFMEARQSHLPLFPGALHHLPEFRQAPVLSASLAHSPACCCTGWCPCKLYRVNDTQSVELKVMNQYISLGCSVLKM